MAWRRPLVVVEQSWGNDTSALGLALAVRVVAVGAVFFSKKEVARPETDCVRAVVAAMTAAMAVAATGGTGSATAGGSRERRILREN
jgi:hypothetical protein